MVEHANTQFTRKLGGGIACQVNCDAPSELPSRIALIGNSLPRRCGIATFTTNLQQAIAASNVDTCIVAVNDHGSTYSYPPSVHFEINAEQIEDYVRAARFLNGGQFDAVSLQHEFGIFGGDAGGHITALLSRLAMPVITTLHTVLPEPQQMQRRVMGEIAEISSSVVVMTESARGLLHKAYGIPIDKVDVILHGIPDFSYRDPIDAKANTAYANKTVILTFGLLSPDKGIEVMIDAMPSILKVQPNAVYIVLGATHPNLIRLQGEVYRETLMARVRERGIDESVVFLDQFVDEGTLLAFISMCDVYVTPYLNEAQMTSGTLAYSFGLGKPVVSTPYWHARELLASGRGILVPFGDANAIGEEIAGLLSDDKRRRVMRERAYTSGRAMTWERTARHYLTVLQKSCSEHSQDVAAQRMPRTRIPEDYALPQMQLSYFLSICDDTGIFQHAVYSVPDRAHGYCVDDNARALLLACAFNSLGDTHPHELPDEYAARFASFVQHAWNPDTQRFRNFMSFDRRWLEDSGSQDSHGRTLWALGECARSDVDPSRRRWARSLFAEALPSVVHFSALRAWGFTLLGLNAYCTAVPGNAFAQHTRDLLARRMLSSLTALGTTDWLWFEDRLTYDNARLPQALLVTGLSTGEPAYIEAGLKSLRWLLQMQTAPAGHFRPVGNKGFGEKRKKPAAFDQQPLEAAATISACLAAWRVSGEVQWKGYARRAFAWYLGGNDLSLPVADVKSGACRDGLLCDGANENRGSESVISYLLGLVEMHAFDHVCDRAGLASLKMTPDRASIGRH